MEGNIMKVCKIEGCKNKNCGQGLCNRHYLQTRKYGKIIGNPIRSNREQNEYVFEQEVCRIILCDLWGNKVAETIIDKEDYDRVKDIKWQLTLTGYTIGNNGKLMLSHFLLNHKSNRKIFVDHINRNKLDNRKLNLRFCTKSQNACNAEKRKDNKSGYRGVFLHRGKWVATIAKNKKTYYLGSFNNKNEAAKAYNEGAKKLHGEYACLNVIN